MDNMSMYRTAQVKTNALFFEQINTSFQCIHHLVTLALASETDIHDESIQDDNRIQTTYFIPWSPMLFSIFAQSAQSLPRHIKYLSQETWV